MFYFKGVPLDIVPDNLKAAVFKASNIKSKLKINDSTYEILQILSASLFDKTQLNQILQSPISQNVKEHKYKQLIINLFNRTLL